MSWCPCLNGTSLLSPVPVPSQPGTLCKCFCFICQQSFSGECPKMWVNKGQAKNKYFTVFFWIHFSGKSTYNKKVFVQLLPCQWGVKETSFEQLFFSILAEVSPSFVHGERTLPGEIGAEPPVPMPHSQPGEKYQVCCSTPVSMTLYKWELFKMTEPSSIPENKTRCPHEWSLLFKGHPFMSLQKCGPSMGLEQHLCLTLKRRWQGRLRKESACLFSPPRVCLTFLSSFLFPSFLHLTMN